MLYQLYETQRAMMEPFSDLAQAAAKLYNNPLSPLGQMPFSQRLSAGYALMHRLGKDYEKPEFGIRTVNVDGTRVLLAACLEQGVRKVVHTSSSAVFGIPATNPVMPDTPPTPAEKELAKKPPEKPAVKPAEKAAEKAKPKPPPPAAKKAPEPKPTATPAAASILQHAVAQLQQYFAGTRTEFDLPLDPQGTEFQQQAWAVLCGIPFGQTISYGEQASRLGDRNKARAVGAANGKNPISVIVPCHRVVGADGSLTGFAAGVPTKAWLLAHERSRENPTIWD